MAPRDVARRIISYGIPRAELWLALAAVSCLGAVLSSAPAVLFAPETTTDPFQAQVMALLRMPVLLASVSFFGVGIVGYAFHLTGRALGGESSFEGVLSLMVWFQVLQLLLQVLLLLMGFVLAPVAGLISLIALPLALWIATNFIDVAFGFDNILKTLGVMFAAVVGLTLGLSVVLALFGVGSGGMPGNV
ncbi:YIP1 family protein [Pseudaestuariivita sp.]|uniref:YIP1 family protein n=1 Tax=Pseudaestuariivita sp. TaxID=2211669 RepID=UPI0040589331